MKKFLVIYGMSQESFQKWKDAPKEAKEEDGKLWNEWFDKNAQHFHDMGAGVGTNTRMTKEGMEKMPNEVGGYSVLKADSLEDAYAFLKTNPHVNSDDDSAYFDVMEIMDETEM